MGERNLVDSTPPDKGLRGPSSILFGIGFAILVVTLWVSLGGFYHGDAQVVDGVGFLCLIPFFALGAYLLPRRHQFEGEMLVVRYTADPPPGQGQQVFKGPTRFRVEVSAGRALSKNISGRAMSGRVVVRGVAGSPELNSYPGRLLDALKDGGAPVG